MSYVELSVRREVRTLKSPTAKDLYDEKSLPRNVLRSEYRYGKTSIRQRVVLTAKCPTAKCPMAKSPTGRNPRTRYSLLLKKHIQTNLFYMNV